MSIGSGRSYLIHIFLTTVNQLHIVDVFKVNCLNSKRFSVEFSSSRAIFPILI